MRQREALEQRRKMEAHREQMLEIARAQVRQPKSTNSTSQGRRNKREAVTPPDNIRWHDPSQMIEPDSPIMALFAGPNRGTAKSPRNRPHKHRRIRNQDTIASTIRTPPGHTRNSFHYGRNDGDNIVRSRRPA